MTEALDHVVSSSQTVVFVQCYEELLVNFPGSIALHREYANFCEVVLSHFEASAKHLSVAEVLETGMSWFLLT